jgi:5'-deoxynucleotidase YfbR-like HD superfamily hydrolase
LACALAPQIDKTLDVGKIAQFATVHDLAEVHAGDTSNFASEAEKATKEERERLALAKMHKELQAFPWICQTIEAYERQDTAEARFVKSVDKLITLLIDYLEEGEFYKENQITLEHWKKQLQAHRKKASSHEAAYAYYEQMWDLLASRPDFFYREKPANSTEG